MKEIENTCAHANWIRDYLNPVENFPIKGITFQWYSALLRDPKAFDRVITIWENRYKAIGKPDLIAGIESRGFFLGAVLAQRMSLPFILIRKPGKLPNSVSSGTHLMEYGTTVLEIEKCSVQKDEKVLIVDDVFATGGTAAAACELIEGVGGKVYEVTSLIEITGLGARSLLKNCRLFSLVEIENG